MVRVGICGVTGYAGYEALRWLRRHRGVQVVFATSEAQAGKSLADSFPGPLDIALTSVEDAPFDQVDVVLLALPFSEQALLLKRGSLTNSHMVTVESWSAGLTVRAM